MAIILSLETSTDVCSAALHDNGVLLAEEITRVPQSHGAQLAPMISRLMKDAGITASTLTAVAVASGPGSYTGLRIGTSMAKGICYAHQIPMVSVPTLDIMIHRATSQMNPGKFFLCPMIDARRMEVYCKVVDESGAERAAVGAVVVDDQSFLTYLQENLFFFFGDGAEKCRSVITHQNAVFLDHIVPLASTLGEMAFEKFQRGMIEDYIHFEPFYLKAFVAKQALTNL